MSMSAVLLANRLNRGSSTCRFASTWTDWRRKPFGYPPETPHLEPTHIRGEGKFSFPPSLKEKYGGKFEWPPINDVSRTAKRRERRELWHTKIEKLQTVEEKIFELNMPKYYGWRSYVIKEGNLHYDPLPKTQYLTRTSVVSESGLPDYYNSLMSEDELNAAVQQIKDQVENALVLEYNGRDQKYQLTESELEDPLFIGNMMAKAISKHINRIMVNNFSKKYEHLLEAQIDNEPRLEAFWFFGGLWCPKDIVRSRANFHAKEFKDEPINQTFKYYGTPVMHLRHNLPLKEFMSQDESVTFTPNIPYDPYDPKMDDMFRGLERATINPGFWPGDSSEFGLVSYNSSAHLATRPKHMNDNKDALTAQAILGSFSWLYTQACYQGFSTFQDPTYPLVNQMILTNGQYWTFSAYQLNTTTMHIDAINKNTKSNLCWMTESMKLFDNVENGKVNGLNKDVLKHLIKFYANAPQVREGIDMKPLLQGEQLIANIEDPERRTWLERKYKHLMSNRSRHRLIPEVRDWQKIYMIKFKTRPMDKKRDPWQYGINPYQRRFDDHAPTYIPRVCRDHYFDRNKWKKDYYPTVPNLPEAYPSYKPMWKIMRKK